jgi:hypothetical protein
MRHRGVFLLSLITWLTILPIVRCQSVCPARCLCRLSQLPSTVQCSKQGLQTFPENISDLVSKLQISNDSISYHYLLQILFVNLL